ncbi:hypothetical protein AB0M28_22095, partial [Streptomyces sp. NPDC051940]
MTPHRGIGRPQGPDFLPGAPTPATLRPAALTPVPAAAPTPRPRTRSVGAAIVAALITGTLAGYVSGGMAADDDTGPAAQRPPPGIAAAHTTRYGSSYLTPG